MTKVLLCIFALLVPVCGVAAGIAYVQDEPWGAFTLGICGIISSLCFGFGLIINENYDDK